MTFDIEEYRAWFCQVPVNQHLGFELRVLDENVAEIALPVQPWFGQETGVVQGGLIGALADTAAAHSVVRSLEPGQRPTGIEYKINFLRPGRLGGGPLVARAKLVRRGRTICLCDVDVDQDGALIAKGLFTFMILPADGSSSPR